MCKNCMINSIITVMFKRQYPQDRPEWITHITRWFSRGIVLYIDIEVFEVSPIY